MRFVLPSEAVPERATDGSGRDGAGGVLLVGYYPPPIGGESIHVRQLARHLRTRGVPVRVINARRGAPPSAEYRSIGGRLDFVRALLQGLDAGTILHLHTNGHTGKSCLMICAAAAPLRMRGAAGVLTLHSGLAPDYLAGLGMLRRSLLRLAVAQFEHVICVNHRIREALRALGVAEAQLSVVPAYLGIPPTGPVSAGEARRTHEFSPLIVAAGGLGPEYGLALLVQAVARLRLDFPRLGFVVVGSGADAELQRQAGRLGLADRVLCVGEIPHERYLAVLSRADLFVRPSYADGDAVSVREALALGIPVVASDTDARPPGVCLFRRGDTQDLAEQITAVLRRGERPGAGVPAEAEDSLAQILGIYRRLWRIAGSQREVR